MKLKTVSYSEHKGESKEWLINKFDLFDINLFVGKNSTGKTRTLNAIAGLSVVIGNSKLNVIDADYELEFEESGSLILYQLKVDDGVIVKEVLKINGDIRINRNQVGTGSMFNEEAGKNLNFQLPPNSSATSKRDQLQYPYLESLLSFTNNVIYFQFGTDLGKSTLVMSETSNVMTSLNIKETNNVTTLLREGIKNFKQPFIDQIINDAKEIDYLISDITVGKQVSIDFFGPNGYPVGILVQELDRKAHTDQFSMSSGMFRALAVIIHFAYYKFIRQTGIIIIDDIGEGLDFERSAKLINLLTSKARETGIQLLMSTNDRFVMNEISLEHWQVLSRSGSEVRVFNHTNSRDKFEEFQFTGLNNFDFFSSKFFETGFEEIK